MFQSSLRPKAERNSDRFLSYRVRDLFQSSLRPKAERNDSGRGVRGRSIVVSILAPPEGGAQPCWSSTGVPSSVFQSSLRPKAERNNLPCLCLSVYLSFNPRSARRRSAPGGAKISS